MHKATRVVLDQKSSKKAGLGCIALSGLLLIYSKLSTLSTPQVEALIGLVTAGFAEITPLLATSSRNIAKVCAILLAALTKVMAESPESVSDEESGL